MSASAVNVRYAVALSAEEAVNNPMDLRRTAMSREAAQLRLLHSEERGISGLEIYEVTISAKVLVRETAEVAG